MTIGDISLGVVFSFIGPNQVLRFWGIIEDTPLGVFGGCREVLFVYKYGVGALLNAAELLQ